MTTTLKHEIKKKRPFDLPEQEAMLNILRTALKEDPLKAAALWLTRTSSTSPSSASPIAASKIPKPNSDAEQSAR